MKVLRITHQKIIVKQETVIPDVQSILLSDPWYKEDVWCRYEQDDLSLNRIKGELIEEFIENGDYPFVSRQLHIHLYQRGFDEKSIKNQKEYELGVDTARYVFKINEDRITVSTGGDGFWGSITERKDSDQHICVDISLLIPDEYRSSQAFVYDMPELIRESLKSMELMQDCDVDIKLDEHGGEMKQC